MTSETEEVSPFPDDEQRSGTDEAQRMITEAPTEDFVELVRISGLDPRRDLRFADWSGIDLSGADLTGFDFRGARLSGCRFDGAKIARALFDLAIVDRAALRKAADWEEHVSNWDRFPAQPSGRHLPHLAVFSDAPFAPEMVVIPPGRFLIGSTERETAHHDVSSEIAAREKPRHAVTIVQPFALAKYPVTFEEYDRFCTSTGRQKPGDKRWGRGRRPAIDVSWDDAQAYLEWLRECTGAPYRLPSEAEWEYACRAGTETAYWWGEEWDPGRAQGGGKGDRTTEVDTFPPNAWGLHDTSGNVLEWCADAWEEDHSRPRAQHPLGRPSGRRALRGGSWENVPRNLRSASRDWVGPEVRFDDIGFRPARTLTP